MADDKKPAQQGAQGGGDTPADDTDDLDTRIGKVLDTRLNAAITGHMKRAQTAWEKALDERLAKLAPAPETKPTDRAPDGPAQKADPEVLKLREQVEKLTRQAEEAARARAAVEDKARRDAARGELRGALEAKGVKGARATAVLAMLEHSGALRFTDEGAAELVIKRARTKGARAEELAFDDLAAGIEDWTKTADAAEFLPAPSVNNLPRRPGAAPGPIAPRAAPATPGRALTADEAADAAARALEQSGVDANDLFT